MRTIVYVDGFNLYYRAVKDTPWKWLDLNALFRTVLGPSHQITGITPRVHCTRVPAVVPRVG